MATTIPPKPRRADRKPGSLYRRMMRLLKDDPRTSEEIARILDLPQGWLAQLRNGDIPKPGVHRAQFIYEKLSGKKLTP